jgi:dTDP-L-rhamnose 4-epimerase
VRANLLALETDEADFQAVNIGTGRSTSVLEIAHLLAAGLDKDVPPDVAGKYREGDIRHCIADIKKASELLGYKPSVSLEDGLSELLLWLDTQSAEDKVAGATNELAARSLVK